MSQNFRTTLIQCAAYMNVGSKLTLNCVGKARRKCSVVILNALVMFTFVTMPADLLHKNLNFRVWLATALMWDILRL